MVTSGRWVVDGINLSTLAFNISNRSAGWAVPAKRGSNLTIPGRHGTTWVANKPFDEGTANLTMWVNGANEDGTLPDDQDMRDMCMTNLDKLTALFGQSSRLLSIVRVGTSAFGRKNMVTNPAMEGLSASSQYSYQNSILNPAGRGQASQGTLTNLMPNPNMINVIGGTANPTYLPRYENLVPDPYARLGRTDDPAILTSNYFHPSNYEALSTGTLSGPLTGMNWDSSMTGAIVSTTTSDRTANPYGGTQALRVLANASSPQSTAVASYPDPFYCPSGYHPAFGLRMRRAAGSTADTVQIRMFSYQSDNVTRYNYSDFQHFTIPTGTTAWTTINFVPTGGTWDTTGSPTDYCGFQVQTGETWPTGDGILVDQYICNLRDTHVSNSSYQSSSYFTTHPSVGPFFDYNSGWGGLHRNSTGAPDDTELSISRWMGNSDDRWLPDAATAATSPYYTFADTGYQSGTTTNFIAHGSTAGVTQGFTLTLAASTVGQTYMLRFQARAASGKACAVKLQKKNTGDASPVTVATVNFTGTGTPVNYGSFLSGTINDYEASAPYTAVAGDQLFVRVEVPSSTSGDPIFQMTSLHVENCAPLYFDGDSNDGVNGQYAWTGTRYNSKSTVSTRRVTKIVNSNVQQAYTETVSGITYQVCRTRCAYDGAPTQIVTENQSLGPNVQGVRAVADIWGGFANPARPTAGTTVRAQLVLDILDASGGVLSTVTTATTTLNNPGTKTEFSIQIAPDDMPSGAVNWRATAKLISPIAGQYIELVDLLVCPFALDPSLLGAPDYFDGATAGAKWTGTANDSTSVLLSSIPANWSADPGLLVGSGVLRGLGRAAGVPAVMAVSPQMDTGAAQVVLTGSVASSGAGTYLVGVGLIVQALDAAGLSVAGDVSVVMQAITGTGLVVGQAIAGGCCADSSATGKTQYFQGMLTTTGSFTGLAVWCVASTGVALLAVNLLQTYLMPLAGMTNTNQRLDFNGIYNPTFITGTKGWDTVGCTLSSTGLKLGATSKAATSPVYVGPSGVSQTVPYGVVGFAGTASLTPLIRTGTVQTNIAPRPNPTSASGGWVSASSTGYTVVRANDVIRRAGTWSAKGTPLTTGTNIASFTYVGASANSVTNIPATPGQDYTVTCYAAASVGSGRAALTVYYYDVDSTLLVTNSQGFLTTLGSGSTFSRTAAYTTTAPVNTAYIRVAVTVAMPVGNSTTGTEAAWVTDCQIEAASTASSYIDGALADVAGSQYLWTGTAGASPSEAFNYTESSLTAIAATTSTQSFGTYTQPSTDTHAALAFTGNAATVSSAYLGPPSGAATDLKQVLFNFFPYFDGSSAKGPMGEKVAWAGAADASASRAVPYYPSRWGNPTSPISLVPHRIAATPPAGSAVVPTRPSSTPPNTTSAGGWMIIPRSTVLNVAKTYRLDAIATGSDDLYLSGEILVRKTAGATLQLDLMMAPDDTSVGTSALAIPIGTTGGTTVTTPTVWTNVPITDSYYYLRISYTDTVAAAGYRASFDNLLMLPTSAPLGEDYPGYFDGNMNNSQWDGIANASTSTYFLGGRQAMVEVRDSIDMTSVAGATRAEFSVNLAIPGAFWEDLIESTIVQPVTNAQLLATGGTPFPLTDLVDRDGRGGTAPIDDAVITVVNSGAVNNLLLTDVATGATLGLKGFMPTGGVTFDCGTFTATQVSGGASVIKNVSRTGSNGFLPITPVSSTQPPSLKVSAISGTTGTLTITIVARRRYLIA